VKEKLSKQPGDVSVCVCVRTNATVVEESQTLFVISSGEYNVPGISWLVCLDSDSSRLTEDVLWEGELIKLL